MPSGRADRSAGPRPRRAAARRTVVIGGGIAGLSVAWQLAELGGAEVTLLERETQPGTHSSARNAQIWLPVDADETTGPLAHRSEQLLSTLMGSEGAWLRRTGALVMVPSDRDGERVREGARAGGLRAAWLTSAELAARSPVLERRGAASEEPALWVQGAGVFDPHAMITALARAARAAGVELRVGAAARGVVVDGGRVRAVSLQPGEELACDEVVIAGGAWASALGRTAGVKVPLVPLRRHLVLLRADPARAGAIVWRFGPRQVYWRPESGGVLASPCDEEPTAPCLPAADDRQLERLAEELEPVAPALVDAPVHTRWACLRTYAHDRELVLGPDPRVEGLAWLAGLGGRGMTVGVGAGELCALAMRGRARSELIERVRPDRRQPPALV